MKRPFAVVTFVVIAVAGCQSAASPSPSTPPGGPAASPSIAPPQSAGASPAPSVADSTAAPSGQAPSGDGPWVLIEAPNLPTYGEKHAARLGDGRVLFLADREAVLESELWDPATNAFERAEPLNKYRSAYVLVALPDGRALVTGGLNQNGQAFSSTYLFDPKTEAWSKSGLLATARTNAVGVVMKDGRVLVAGGHYQNNSNPMGAGQPGIVLAAFHPSGLADVDVPIFTTGLATAEVFDPDTETWSSIRPMTFARSGPDAVTLADGRVLVFGSEISWNTGAAVDDRVYGTAEIYDPAANRWTMTGPLPALDRAGLTARGPAGANPIPEEAPQIGHGSLVALPNGDVLLVGLEETWKHVGEVSRSFRYDAATNRWAQIGDTYLFVGEPTEKPFYIEDARNLNGTAVTVMPDGSVLVAGGWRQADPHSDEVNHPLYDASDWAQYIDPSTGKLSDALTMPAPRVNGDAMVLADGSVLIYGGQMFSATGDDPVPTIVRFLP